MPHTVLVVGPGRCGTSFVTQIIHEKIGIPMCEIYLIAPHQPDGFWEDPWFVDLDIEFNKGEVTVEDYIKVLKYLISLRNTTWETWGLKNPQTQTLEWTYLRMVSNPVIIRCTRDHEMIAKSFFEKFPKRTEYNTFKEALEWVHKLEGRLDRQLIGHECFMLDFTAPLTEEHVEQKLREYFKEKEVSVGNFFKALKVIGYDISFNQLKINYKAVE